ncbi:gliding motility protein GldM [Flaviaesturariibacter amylovorans]|uniref:Gliding motility protein GldM n=2 Tax=Flaviaesturariibacter amylovorans TaxID=1084520 RepID=A0ABP8GCX9_9BACT
MINLMYLVLTALLALNVSAEILNAFKTVNRSLAKTNETMNASTSAVMGSFEELRKDPNTRVKAELWLPKAQSVISEAKIVNDLIQNFKDSILNKAGFDRANPDKPYKEDNQDIATHFMVEQKNGERLRAALENFKNKMMALAPNTGNKEADDKVRSDINEYLKQIDLVPPPSKTGTQKPSWSDAYFHMVPTVASITILSKFQNDVKTVENRMATLFHEQVGKVVVRYDAFAAIVGQSSNYIMPGGKITVNAGVGAFSKAAAPQITINGQSAPLGPDGQAQLDVAGGALGKHAVPVVIRFVDQDGKPQTVTKNVEYTVGQANASIALDKMNVLYRDIANPITVAASGGGDDRISVAITNGRLEKTGAGKYNAFVSGGNEATITVSVDGKAAGASQFRVRDIPKPTASVGGYASGDNVNAGAFRAQPGVIAWIKDFPFEIKYTVTSFTISTDGDDGDIVDAKVSGNQWGAAARNVMAQVKPGKTVYIDEIRAQAENGKSFKLPSLVYYIK